MFRKQAFYFKNERVEFRGGDFASHDTKANTIVFLRGSERMYTENGDDKILIHPEDGEDALSVIGSVTDLTPMMRDEDGSIVIYELMGQKVQ